MSACKDFTAADDILTMLNIMALRFQLKMSLSCTDGHVVQYSDFYHGEILLLGLLSGVGQLHIEIRGRIALPVCQCHTCGEVLLPGWLKSEAGQTTENLFIKIFDGLVNPC